MGHGRICRQKRFTNFAPKIADIQAQIDSTVDIMHQNITKVAERGERLDALQDKTGGFSQYPTALLTTQTISRCPPRVSDVVLVA